MCKLQERDDIGRIELVQQLGKRKLSVFAGGQKKEQEKSETRSTFPLGDAGLKGWKVFLPGCMFEEQEYFILNSFGLSVFFLPSKSMLLSKKRMTTALLSQPVVYDTDLGSSLFTEVDS